MSEQRNDETGAAEPGPNWVMRGPQEEPEAHEAPPEEPAPPRQGAAAARSRRRAPFLLLLLVVIVAFGVSLPFWAPRLIALFPGSAPAQEDALAQQLHGLDQRLGELARQQSALNQHLAGIEQRLGSTASAGTQQQQAAALKELGGRLAALEQHQSAPAPAETAEIKDLGAQVAALGQQLQKLTAAQSEAGDRMAKLEARDTMPAAQRTDQALLLALGELRQQVDSAVPYADALETVEGLGRDRPEIRSTLAPLEPLAKQGLPSLEALARRFEQQVVPAVLHASAATPASDSWSDRILAKLRSLVVIRRVGANAVASSDPVDAAIARAEAALDRHDLAGAVDAVAQLPERDAAPAQSWLAAARQRLAAEQALTQLTDALTQRMTADTAR